MALSLGPATTTRVDASVAPAVRVGHAPSPRDVADVTVIIPARDRERCIDRAIRSVLDQTVSPRGVVVVDDGSNDRTAQRAHSWAEHGVRVVEQPGSGVCAARNAGAALTDTTYLLFLDSDDVARPDWIEQLVGAAVRTGADVVSAGIQGHDGLTDWADASVSDVRSADGAGVLPTDMGSFYRHQRGLFRAGSFVITRTLFNSLGGFDTALDHSEHTDLALRITARASRGLCRMTTISGIVVDVVNRPGRRAPGSRLTSARRLLDVHQHHFARNRRMRSLYEGIVGVNAHELGDRRSARRYLSRAVIDNPTRGITWARLARTFVARSA